MDGSIRLESESVLNANTSFCSELGNLRLGAARKPFDFAKFEENAVIRISLLNALEMEFDLVGVHASLANAIRRILLAEVPIMAIEKVFVMNNTSIVHDEILSHRLGLIPILADPRRFEFKKPEDDSTDLNTIVFQLKVKCERNPGVDSSDISKKYKNANVYSGSLVWVPQGIQSSAFKDAPIRPVQADILIAKLRPGQEIDLELHCEKNVGREHAKWSPVATASYRLLPEIVIKKSIVGDLATKFAACFPQGVIDVQMKSGTPTAVVVNARKDTVSRECLRYPEFADSVALLRKRDHYIFSVESTGAIPPHVIVHEAFTVLIDKCEALKVALQDMMNGNV